MRHPSAATIVFTTGLTLLAGRALLGPRLIAQPVRSPTAPVAVRNDRPHAGQEVLVLRHQALKKGAHETYYRASLAGVWPWYEQIGTRIVGQWLVVERDGTSVAAAAAEDAYRLARYASVEHWRATRDGQNAQLGGNGPSRDRSLESGRDRTGVQTGSNGAYFLQGQTAQTRPLYMPGLAERYERVGETAPSPTDEIIAVRTDAARPGQEIVELRYQRIEKGAFERFVTGTRDAVWPWEEKLGARPLGQWKVIFPEAPSRTKESPDYDEVITMTRYASREHWLAMAPERAVLLGGNGPDWRDWRAAFEANARLTKQTSVELMQGEMYYSPPIFTPPLPERYRLAR
jgi:hypothetical protein